MSFWLNLPTYLGAQTNYMGVMLAGQLVYQAGQGTKPGPLYLSASVMANGDCVISDKEIKGAKQVDTAKVFWLPWLNLHITSVTWQALNKSGCKFFLTSEFSGCRFVADSKGVAHIAHWQVNPQNWQAGNTSKVRDNSEWFFRHGGMRPYGRRKLSYTDENHSSMGATNTCNSTYGGHDKASRAIVLGYKGANTWHFKALKYKAGTRGQGVWANV